VSKSAKVVLGRVLIKSQLFGNRLPRTTCALRQMFRRSSAAVATSREGHRCKDQAGQEADLSGLFGKRLGLAQNIIN
jgi:hypothetical protein